MKKNIGQLSNSLKTKEFRVFVLFFLLSLFFWVITKLSSDYEVSIPVTVQIKNIPKDKFVTQETHIIKVTAETSGFNVLQQVFKTPTLQLNLKQLSPNKEGSFLIETMSLRSELNTAIGSTASIKSILPKSIDLAVVSYSSKKVPVSLSSELEFRPGFDFLNPMRITPDSIQVFGPESILDSLKGINTATLSLTDIHEDFSKQLPLKPLGDTLQYNVKMVTVYADIDQYVHKELKIPVKIAHAPNDKSVTIFPKEITVRFKSPISLYNKITPDDFEIYADFKQRDEANIPLIVKYTPNFLKELNLKQRSVAFVTKS